MKLIFRGNETRILGALSDVRRQDCLLRGKSRKREKVALNFCGGIVSTYKRWYLTVISLYSHLI